MKYFAMLVMLIVMVAGLHAEKIYKWVDENGQIHYSSQKPPGQEAETVKVKRGPRVSQDDSTASSDKTGDQAEDESEADAKAKAELAKADEANMKRLCEQARKNIASLNATVRITKVDEKTGEKVRMNDEQRLEAMKNAQKAVKEYCK